MKRKLMIIVSTIMYVIVLVQEPIVISQSVAENVSMVPNKYSYTGKSEIVGHIHSDFGRYCNVFLQIEEITVDKRNCCCIISVY